MFIFEIVVCQFETAKVESNKVKNKTNYRSTRTLLASVSPLRKYRRSQGTSI